MIRLMTMDDYDAVYKLWSGASTVGMRVLDDSPEGIRHFLNRNSTTCFVYEEQGNIYGVILGGQDGRRGFIYHTAVSDSMRRKGIGRQLVNALLEAMKNEGINKVALVVFERNTGGNGFWEALGFTTRPDLVYRNMSLNDANVDVIR